MQGKQILERISEMRHKEVQEDVLLLKDGLLKSVAEQQTSLYALDAAISSAESQRGGESHTQACAWP